MSPDNMCLGDRGRARLGVIVPVSNTNLEPDMIRIKPGDVSVHFTRAGGYDLEAVPDSIQMAQFADTSLGPVLEALVAARPDAIMYGCTSATLAHGPDYDAAFCNRIENQTGVPGITAAGALCEALTDLKIFRAGFGSPYTRTLNREGAAFLQAKGFDICHVAYIGSDLGNYGQGALTPKEVLALGQDANHHNAEAVVLSCTDMRSVEIVTQLEQQIGKPVICSNQAMMYVACKRLRLPNTVPGILGTLTTR